MASTINETDIRMTYYASTGLRFANYFADWIILSVLSYPYGYLLGLVLGYLGLYTEGFKNFIQTSGRLGEYVIVLPLWFIYYFFFESNFKRTPGKFITKTKVLDICGAKPTKVQIMQRSLSRLVPFEPLSGFGTKKWSGWHDRWSSTMVVSNDYPEITKEIPALKEEPKITIGVSSEVKTDRKTKKCHYCGEEILYEAVKCQYCKEFLDKNKV